MGRKVFSALLITGIVLLLAYISFQSAEDSYQVTHDFALFLRRLMRKTGVRFKYNEIHTVVRTAAHFVIFFVLGGLVTWLASAWGKRAAWIVAVLLTAVAFLVELGKLVLDDRHFEMDEALLNIAGVWFGVGVWWLCGLVADKIMALRAKKQCTESNRIGS